MKITKTAVPILIIITIALTLAQDQVDWNDPDQFSANFESDPNGAFSSNPEKSWERIEQKPSLLINQKVLDAAFNNNPTRAAAVINLNTKLLDAQNVQAKFDEAAAKDVKILNDNTQAKAEWLKKKYSITMADTGVEIRSYDGKKMATGGEKGTAFTIKDVPGALILSDGSLRFKDTAIISGTEEFSLSRDVQGREYYKAKGGVINFEEKLEFAVKAEKSAVRLPYAPKKNIKYEGTFDLQDSVLDGSEGQLVKGTFTRTTDFVNPQGEVVLNLDSLPTTIDGTIFQNKKEFADRFVVLEKTSLTAKDGTVFSVQTNSRIYYTEESNRRDGGEYCQKNAGFSCIINTPSSTIDSSYRERLAFVNVQEGDKVSVKTPSYFSRVEVLDQKGGEVTFSSVENKRVVSEIKSVAGQPPKTKGRLDSTRAGRFDVLYNKDLSCQGKSCEKTLHHWSSNRFQKDPGFFVKPRDHFATCTFGVECEGIFAEQFGQVIRPKDPRKDIATTIIVSGDSTSTARSMQNFCLEEGCYIINSRDTPPVTRSSKIVVTGHHYAGDDSVWRDPPEAKEGVHNSIDRLYFNQERFGSPLDSLPEQDPNRPVTEVAFSACNTVTSLDNTGFEELRAQYPRMTRIQGWDGTAPLEEVIDNVAVSQDERSVLVESFGEGADGKKKGERAWYVKQPDGTWIWTAGKQGDELKISTSESYD